MAEKLEKVEETNEKVLVSEEEVGNLEFRFKVLVNSFEEDGVKKYSYKMLTKKGRVKLWFRNEVSKEQRPTKTCFMTVLRKNLSLDERFEYPIFWVSKIEKIEEIAKSDKISDYLD